MYVSKDFQVYTAQAMEDFMKRVKPTWRDILTIDYFYYHHTSDYDGGLSFFDRLNKKLGKFHDDWNIDDFKNIVRNANDPQTVYEDIVKYMLEDPGEIVYYGI